jgi:TonB family protein
MAPGALCASLVTHALLVLLAFSVTFPQIARPARCRLMPLVAPPIERKLPRRLPLDLCPRRILPPRFQPAISVARPVTVVLPAPAPLPTAVVPQSLPLPHIEIPRPSPPPGATFTAGINPIPPPTTRIDPRPGTFESAREGRETPAVKQGQIASAGFGQPPAASGNGGNASRKISSSVFGESSAATRPAAANAARPTGTFASVIVTAGQPAAKPQPAGTQFEPISVKPFAAPGAAKVNSGVARTPLEILQKPRPVYSEEARHLQLEGEVVLDALFGASGQIQVTRVLRGLGHGLDEKAIQAATGIRFHPATENGVAVDTSAVVRIAFQLAY